MASTSPLVSVIVPNYNHARFLRQRIDSILNQTIQDFELILLDDCSSDGSVEILRACQSSPKVTALIINEKNSGSPFTQWNNGLKIASGEFVWIAESDDWAAPQFLEHTIKPLRTSENVVVSYCHSQTIDEHGGKFIGDYFWPAEMEPERWGNDFENNGADEISRYLAFRNTIPNASSVVFRRSVALQCEVPEGMSYAGDWIFWIRMLRHGGISFCRLPLSYFRQHSASTRIGRSFQQERRRVRELLLAVSESNTPFQPRHALQHRDHCWFIREWSERNQQIPLWVLAEKAVPFRTRFAFFAAAARSVLRKHRLRIET